MTTLETRRLRGDLIQVYKILNEFEAIDCLLLFNASETNLRGHGLKLFKHRFSTNIGKLASSNCVAVSETSYRVKRYHVTQS